MSTSISSSPHHLPPVVAATIAVGRHRQSRRRATTQLAPFLSQSHRNHQPSLFISRAANDSKISDELGDRSEGSSWPSDDEADKIVDGVDFGELCNEFECISSPLVESTARQLARDILDLRQPHRSLQIFAVFVKYKDPVREFTGRDKYKRHLSAFSALDNPTVTIQEMTMESRSILNIKWRMKGKPKLLSLMGMRMGGDGSGGGGELIVKVNSKFSLNQISGQVIEHEEFWDLSDSESDSGISEAFFWVSRYLFASIEAGKDIGDSLRTFTTQLSTPKQDLEIFSDPSGDPTKFFQDEDGFQRDAYQFALLLAVLYFLVQYLRTIL